MDQDLLSTPFRPVPIRVINAIARALARLGVIPISLDPDSLLKAASEATGLSDFGRDSFLPGFRMLLESIEADARLTLFGRFFARRQLLELIGHRLQLAPWLYATPDFQYVIRPDGDSDIDNAAVFGAEIGIDF